MTTADPMMHKVKPPMSLQSIHEKRNDALSIARSSMVVLQCDRSQLGLGRVAAVSVARIAAARDGGLTTLLVIAAIVGADVGSSRRKGQHEKDDVEHAQMN
jgi:hypothetical protein